MDFLKNSPRFSFLYDGKPHTESLLETTQTENGVQSSRSTASPRLDAH